MKHFLISLFLLLPLCAISQVQQRYVRTIGRPGIPGKALPGVVVRVRGMMNKILTSDDGYFELVMSDKKKGDAIYFTSISKKGYDLCDKKFLSDAFVYSPGVTLEITMVDLEQLERDKLRIEENAYRVGLHRM